LPPSFTMPAGCNLGMGSRRSNSMAFAVLAFVVLGCCALANLTSAAFVPGALHPSTQPALGSARRYAAQSTITMSVAGTTAFAAAVGMFAAAVGAAFRSRTTVMARNSVHEEEIELGRREAMLPAALLAAVSGAGPAFAEEASPAAALPTKISVDPYELLGIDPEDKKQDKKEFDMHKNYRQDTYQVVKHMKISGSIDKGAPRMEKWNKRVKEEMNDWVALYRRQDAVVGRQSYYALYSAVNTLASHFTSYGPKFPFPNKRRARFYELINQTERYLEKNK